MDFFLIFFGFCLLLQISGASFVVFYNDMSFIVVVMFLLFPIAHFACQRLSCCGHEPVKVHLTLNHCNFVRFTHRSCHLLKICHYENLAECNVDLETNYIRLLTVV